MRMSRAVIDHSAPSDQSQSRTQQQLYKLFRTIFWTPVFCFTVCFSTFLTTPGWTDTLGLSLWSLQCITLMSTSSVLSRWCLRPQQWVSLIFSQFLGVFGLYAFQEVHVVVFLFHRSIPVSQWSTKCSPLSVNWWFSYFHDGLRGHLFSLHSLLHVSAGQSCST